MDSIVSDTNMLWFQQLRRYLVQCRPFRPPIHGSMHQNDHVRTPRTAPIVLFISSVRYGIIKTLHTTKIIWSEPPTSVRRFLDARRKWSRKMPRARIGVSSWFLFLSYGTPAGTKWSESTEPIILSIRYVQTDPVVRFGFWSKNRDRNPRTLESIDDDDSMEPYF